MKIENSMVNIFNSVFGLNSCRAMILYFNSILSLNKSKFIYNYGLEGSILKVKDFLKFSLYDNLFIGNRALRGGIMLIDLDIANQLLTFESKNNKFSRNFAGAGGLIFIKKGKEWVLRKLF